MIYIGFGLLIIGMCMMDSDRIDIPLAIAFTGIILMFFGQKLRMLIDKLKRKKGLKEWEFDKSK